VESAVADSILHLGDEAYGRSEYDSATQYYLKGREKARLEGDSTAVARADTWRGLAAMRLGKNDEAKRIGEAALAMKKRLDLKSELFRSYNALGLLAYNQGRYSDAVLLYSSAKASAQAVNDSLSAAKAMGNLGMVHSDLGEFELARTEFLQFADMSRKARQPLALANQLSNLGMLEIRSGNAEAAFPWLWRAMRIYRSIDYATGMESVMGQMGSAYESLGEPQKAIAYLDSAISIARQRGLVREEAEDLQLYGEMIGEAGDHNAALRHLSRARMLTDSAQLESRRGDIARAQARELAAISRIDLAVTRAKEAIQIHRKAGNELEQLDDNLLLAELTQGSKDSGQSKRALTEAARLTTKLSVPVARENLALGTARVADLAGDPAGVLKALPASLQFVRLGARAAGEAQALRARAFGKLGQWPEAVAAGRKAVAALDMVRGKIGEGPLRAAFTSDNASIYADLVLSLLQLGRTNEAFEVADAARGKTLLEHLSALRASARASARDVAESDRLLRRIDYLTGQLRSSDTLRSPERSVALRRDQQVIMSKLTAARNEYEDRMKRAARVDPRGGVLLGTARVGVSEIRSALGPGEVLVEFFAAAGGLYVFMVARDTVASAMSAVSVDELGDRVRLASDLLSRSAGAANQRRILRGLYDLLIAPVASLPQFRRATTMIVVPHSSLAYLPFAALEDKTGRRLVESRSILTMPSASAVPILRHPQPAMPDRSSSVFAPFPTELRGTLEEATAVKAESNASRSFIGSRATESQLRAALEKGGNVHVATHAVLNQTNPMFSRIELSPGKRTSSDDDGSLDVHELLRIPVNNNLVYLSGCETGAGAAWSTSFRRGQDYATLSQAMLYAGAQNVVATLWRIDDLGASVFAQRFYAALATTNPVDALAQAQRQTMRDPRYSAPRYWAGYTVSGSGITKRRSQKAAAVAVQ
jgi:CHAT domain-containing protein